MERLLSAARAAGAKVVLVGDPEQLQAIEAGAAFRALAERHGAAEITEVRRQRVDWQRDATRELATARTGEALARYAAAGMVHAAGTRADARAALVAGWDAVRQERPDASQVILTYTRDDAQALNELARGRMRATGHLRGPDQVVAAELGHRAFAAGDRIMFQRNERGLGGDGRGRGGVAVKNGTLGTVLEVASGGERLTVRVDGRSAGSEEKRGGGREDSAGVAGGMAPGGGRWTRCMCWRRRTWIGTRPMSG
jgi:ATP-dependent exoDNAse (exonuclease V) alpha subunit